MDWKAEALVRVRKARLNAATLRCDIGNVEHSLRELGGYDDEYIRLRDAVFEVHAIVQHLFDLEGKLSRPS